MFEVDWIKVSHRHRRLKVEIQTKLNTFGPQVPNIIGIQGGMHGVSPGDESCHSTWRNHKLRRDRYYA